MTVLITLTTAGPDSGPFDLYSNLDSYTVPFETGVNKAALVAGYSSALVPDYTTSIQIKSIGGCINYINISVVETTTTTSTSSTTSTTSTTTTLCPFYEYSINNALCSSCASVFAIGNIINSQPLVLGKWYYDSVSMTRITPTAFIGCSAGPADANVDPSTQQDFCVQVICPTTSTTTTVAPVFEFKMTVPFATSVLACAETINFPTDIETADAVIGLGTILYYDNTLTPVAGGGNWFNILPDASTVYQINGSGQVIAMFIC